MREKEREREREREGEEGDSDGRGWQREKRWTQSTWRRKRWERWEEKGEIEGGKGDAPHLEDAKNACDEWEEGD